jgi:hypothetical protein
MRQRVLFGLALPAQCLGFRAHRLKALAQPVHLGTFSLDVVRPLCDLVLQIAGLSLEIGDLTLQGIPCSLLFRNR